MLGLPLHHVGIACDDIEATAAFVRRAYLVVSDSGTIFDPEQDASVRLFNEGMPGAFELVAGPVVARLVRNATTYYHMCYRTPDIRRSIGVAQENGAIPVSAPKPAVLFGGRLVAFMLTPLGLIELLEDA